MERGKYSQDSRRTLSTVDLRILVLILLPILIISCSSPNSPDEQHISTTVTMFPSDEDVTPPLTIFDADFQFTAPDELKLVWTAPYDDSPSEPVEGYEIRYSYSFVDTTTFWETAFIIPPDSIAPPSSPGASEYLIIPEFARGRKIHAAIKSWDEANNYSAMSNIAEYDVPGVFLSGSCVNVYTKSGISGLYVDMATPSGIHYVSITDGDGEFSFQELPTQPYTMTITTGTSGTDYHTFSLEYDLADDLEDEHFTMIPVEALDCNWDGYYRSTLHLAHTLWNLSSMRRLGLHVENTWMTWESLPIEVYVPDGEGCDPPIDFEAYIEDAILYWNERAWNEEADITLFEIVSSEPSTGIYFSYDDNCPGPERGGSGWRDWLLNGIPLKSEITICTNLNCIEEILTTTILHELGHTIGFGHSSATVCNHLMLPNGAPDITEDEERAIRLLYSLPNGTNFDLYSF